MGGERTLLEAGSLNKRWPCWIEVDLDAICRNVSSIKRLLNSKCQVMAVVKSQAYGHGMVPVAKAAVAAGATWLGVSRVREGVQLRGSGLDTRILLLGPIADAEMPEVVSHKLTPTVVSKDAARLLSESAVAEGLTVPVHIKVDTGLGRFGAPFEEVRELVKEIAALPGLELEGLYSHFATADDEDSSYAKSQLEMFHYVRRELEGDGFNFRLVHMAASGGTLAVSSSDLDLVRIGLSLYGLYPASHMAGRVELEPALSMHSSIARVFTLQPGQSVGYGRTYVASEHTYAALVPVGYADGLPRSHSNRGYVLVNGQRAPLIGRISMDQCVVDVSGCGNVRVGDPVVVIGRQGEECISCEEFAARSGTINYEVVTSLGYRVPRVYISNGRVVGVGFLDQGRVEGWCF